MEAQKRACIAIWKRKLFCVWKAPYGCSLLVNTKNNFLFKNKKYLLNRLIRMVGELEVKKSAIGVKVLADSGVNGLLEELGDPITAKMGVAKAVLDN